MGQPKLLLPFGETTVIGQLLATLRSSDTEQTLALVRPDDDPLCEEVTRGGGVAVQPDEPPPEMRVSVEHLLRRVEQKLDPQPGDGWLLIPADHPLLTRNTLDILIAHWRQQPEKIVLPAYGGRRGHPTIFPWSCAAKVFKLPENVGVNRLLHAHPEAVLEVPVDDPTVTLDLDTPEDYQRAVELLADPK
jgi:molybdenum cofactor cytidylyltransferase